MWLALGYAADVGLSAIGGFFEAAWSGITSAAGAMADGIAYVFKGMVNTVSGFINYLIGMWNGIQFTVPTIDLGPAGVWGRIHDRRPNDPFDPYARGRWLYQRRGYGASRGARTGGPAHATRGASVAAWRRGRWRRGRWRRRL